MMPRKTTESQKVDLMKARPVAKCNVREARPQLKEIIALAESGTAPVVLTRHGHHAVALVSAKCRRQDVEAALRLTENRLEDK
jgi:prevent-host-death family protein